MEVSLVSIHSQPFFLSNVPRALQDCSKPRKSQVRRRVILVLIKKISEMWGGRVPMSAPASPGLPLSRHTGGSSAAASLGSNFSHVHRVVQCLIVPATSDVPQSAQVWRGGRREVVHSHRRVMAVTTHKPSVATRAWPDLEPCMGRKLVALRTGGRTRVTLMSWHRDRKANAEASQ